jgi:hypothetical protein
VINIYRRRGVGIVNPARLMMADSVTRLLVALQRMSGLKITSISNQFIQWSRNRPQELMSQTLLPGSATDVGTQSQASIINSYAGGVGIVVEVCVEAVAKYSPFDPTIQLPNRISLNFSTS